jgi:hypothetical protein
VSNLNLDEPFPRAIAGRDRRTTLKALGLSALLAAFSQSPSTQARKRKNGNNRPTTKPKPIDRCQLQDRQCRAFFTDLCAPEVDPQACEELLFPCCSSLGKCEPTSFYACLVGTA